MLVFRLYKVDIGSGTWKGTVCEGQNASDGPGITGGSSTSFSGVSGPRESLATTAVMERVADRPVRASWVLLLGSRGPLAVFEALVYVGRPWGECMLSWETDRQVPVST